MHQIDPNMRACMDACHECNVTCLHMAMNHCVETGGQHTQPAHVKIMFDCAQICAAAIDFMACNSAHRQHICRDCAEICRACAASCEGLDGMEDCAAACRKCADACDRMAA